MPKIEGILESVERIKGSPLFTSENPDEKVEDLKIVVGGIEFYKTLWEPTMNLLRRYGKKTEIKKFWDVFTFNQHFPRQEFFAELENNVGKRVEVDFEDVTKGLIYYWWDRIYKIKIPRKHREIRDIDCLE